MAFGDGADDADLAYAWERFCDRLKDAGQQAFKDLNPASSIQRADAFRMLSQNLGQAFDLALETKNPRYPLIHPFSHPTCKLGGDCADFTYHQAWIDGQSVYRLSGKRGDAPFFTIAVQGARGTGPGVLHEPFGDTPQVALTGQQLQTNPDGSFEVFIGGPREAPNWLPTTSESRKLFIRQGFDSWDEQPATLSIERVDMTDPRPMPTPAELTAAMDWAGDFLTGLMADWPEYPFRYGGVDGDHPNRFPPMDTSGADAIRGRSAVNMHWALNADEALVIEFDAHPGLWMVTNMGAMFTSMDYLYRPVSYTPSRTHVDTDGRIRLILAHDDPGYHNWLDTQGFTRGNLTYRHMLAGAPVSLDTRLINRNALADALPADTARIDKAGRQAQLWARFTGIRARFRM